MERPIYLDNLATTPVDPRVLEAMMPFLREAYGNAASATHLFGHEAREAVEKAREQVASLINAEAREIVFTSGATESNNLAILGVLAAVAPSGGHIVSCGTEHPAVLDTLAAAVAKGFDVTLLGVDRRGSVDRSELEAALRTDTVLVSIMSANNEIGSLQPLGEIGNLLRDRPTLFHTDAAQTVGKTGFDVHVLGIDLASISGHKMYAPKGVGALYVGADVQARVTPQMHGGGHERGLRSGTLNVPGCVALGEAARLATEELNVDLERVGRLRTRLVQGLREIDPELIVNGHPHRALAGCLSATFSDIEADALMLNCPQVALSAGSACSSAAPKSSHVLEAIGLSADQIERTVRFGIGRFNDAEQIDQAIGALTHAISRLRSIRHASAVA